MRKSVLGVCTTVAVLALLFYEKNYLPESDEVTIYESLSVGAADLQEETASEVTGYEFVKAAEMPVEKKVIIIEDEAVPLAAAPIEGGEVGPIQKENEKTESEPPKAEKAETESAAVEKAAPQKEKAAVFAAAVQDKENTLEDLGGGIRGYYDDEASVNLLSQINIMRTGGSGAGALSAELNDIARKRALACVKDFSHNGMETAGECMAIGQMDAAGVITSWYASDDHRTYISDPAYTKAGTACIRYDKGNGQMQSLWVLVLN